MMTSQQNTHYPDQSIKLSASEESEAHERLIGSLIETMSDPVLEVNLSDRKLVGGNAAALALFGYPRRRLSGMDLVNILESPIPFFRALKNRVGLQTGVRLSNSSGGSFSAGIRCIFLHKQVDVYVLLVLHDIVDPQRAAKEAAARESLALEILKTRSAFFLGEEHERERLARELHSHIGPVMVSVKLGMEKMLSGRKKYISRRELRQLLEVHTASIKQVRIVTSRLAEGFQYEENINLAIESLIKSYAEFSDIRFFCKTDPLPAHMSTTISYHLFQIIEETLTNMVKHANATKASLRINVHGNKVDVTLQDNGDGAEKPVIKKGSGLWMMKERALLMGGKLRLESAKHRFFRIRLSFSL